MSRQVTQISYRRGEYVAGTTALALRTRFWAGRLCGSSPGHGPGDRPGEFARPGAVSLAGWMEAVLGEKAATDHLRVHRHMTVSGHKPQRVVHRFCPQGHHRAHRLRQRGKP